MPAINAVAKGAAAVGAHLVRDVSLPALVLHRDALEHNIRWMQAFVSNSGAELAPHGKTSMMPALFQRQIEAGAWGITLANAVQTRAAQLAALGPQVLRQQKRMLRAWERMTVEEAVAASVAEFGAVFTIGEP